MLKVPDECYREYGSDLDGCSTQEREGCGSCVLAKRVAPNTELIQQARECAVCMIGADECHRESCKIDSCADVIDLLADALEAAQKENERLKDNQCSEDCPACKDRDIAFNERDAYKKALEQLEHMISEERSGNRKREHSVGVVVAIKRAREVLKGE